MIVDLEKLKKARTAVGIVWTIMDTDSQLAEDVAWVSELLIKVIDDLELYKEACILLKEEGGNNVKMDS